MPRPGSNLPGFRERQLDFAAHIRNPEANPAPADVESRRMKIYVELFYNNIESFLATGFPIARKVLGAARWHEIVRDFVHRHASESPYFLEISQEFLTYLDQMAPSDLPPFLLELCHYEWVELALSVAEEDIPSEGVDRPGDLLTREIVVSPVIWLLSYRYPVHEIGPAHQPAEPPAEPTHLVVYRDRGDKVRFLVVNGVTLRLVGLLQQAEEAAERLTGHQALLQVLAELPDVDPEFVYNEGVATLYRLRDADILAGTALDRSVEA